MESKDPSSLTDLPPVEPIFDLLNAFRKSQIVFTCVDLKIFDSIQETVNPTCSDLAKKLSLNEDALERLLNACIGLGLLHKNYQTQELSLPLPTQVYLTQSSSKSLVGYFRHSQNVLYKLWSGLPSSIRTGTNCWNETFGFQGSEIFQHLYQTETDIRRFISGMHSFSTLSSDSISKAFDFSNFKQAVDLGGATGALIGSLCTNYKNLKGCIFELPNVVPFSREYVEKIPNEDVKSRIFIREGNFFSDDIPEADLFILSRILHDWNEEKCKIILKKIIDKLPSGGALLIAEILLNETKTEPLYGTFQSLNMLVQTEGKERSASEYISLLQPLGFSNIQPKVTGTYLDAILAFKQ